MGQGPSNSGSLTIHMHETCKKLKIFSDPKFVTPRNPVCHSQILVDPCFFWGDPHKINQTLPQKKIPEEWMSHEEIHGSRSWPGMDIPWWL